MVQSCQRSGSRFLRSLQRKRWGYTSFACCLLADFTSVYVCSWCCMSKHIWICATFFASQSLISQFEFDFLSGLKLGWQRRWQNPSGEPEGLRHRYRWRPSSFWSYHTKWVCVTGSHDLGERKRHVSVFHEIKRNIIYEEQSNILKL